MGGGGGGEGEDGDEEEGDVCLTCGLSSDPAKLLRCSNCANIDSGLGVFHYDCLKPPLDAKPSPDEEVGSTVAVSVVTVVGAGAAGLS